MQALSPHVLNRSATKDYLKSLSSRHPQEPPEIVIELYFENSAITAPLKGTNNLLKEDSPGVRTLDPLSTRTMRPSTPSC